MCYGRVYVITNLINGKQYVGQTIQPLKTRFNGHYYHSSRHSMLGNSMKFHGKNNFKIETLIECNSREEMNQHEIFYIDNLNTLKPNGYNLALGGYAVSKGVWELTEESRERMRECKRQSFIFNSPGGKDIVVHDLVKLCKDNNLNYRCMSNVHRRVQDFHRGWSLPETTIDKQFSNIGNTKLFYKDIKSITNKYLGGTNAVEIHKDYTFVSIRTIKKIIRQFKKGVYDDYDKNLISRSSVEIWQ